MINQTAQINESYNLACNYMGCNFRNYMFVIMFTLIVTLICLFLLWFRKHNEQLILGAKQ